MERPIKGIWYEESRRRWRVKLSRDKKVVHRSYHRSYDSAFKTWQEVTDELAKRNGHRIAVPVREASLFNRWACNPITGPQ